MNPLQRAARWLILTVLVVATAAMHTQMPGACPAGASPLMSSATPLQPAPGITSMQLLAVSTTSLMPGAALSSTARTHQSGAPGPDGPGMSEVCQATPVHPALTGGAPAVLMLMLPPLHHPGLARRQAGSGRRW